MVVEKLKNSFLKKKALFLISGAVLIMLAAIVFYFVYFSFPFSFQASQSISEVMQAPVKKIPASLELCAGQIVEIKAQTIRIKAAADRNPWPEDRYYTVTIAEETSLIDYSGYDFSVNQQGKAILTLANPKIPASQDIQVREGKMVLKNSSDVAIGTSSTASQTASTGIKKISLANLAVGGIVIVFSVDGDILQRDNFAAKMVYYKAP